jgi:hypothetical protein
MYSVRTEYRNHDKSTYFQVRLKVQTFRVTYQYVPVRTQYILFCLFLYRVHTGYMLTLVEYLLFASVPDSIARPPGTGSPAGLLASASDSGTDPCIEPNSTQAGLFTIKPFRQPKRHALFPPSWQGGFAGLAGASSSAAGGGSRSSGCSSSAFRCRLAATSCSPSSNHSSFEVLGLGASAGAGHRLNLLVVGRAVRVLNNSWRKTAGSCASSTSSIMISFRRARWVQASVGSLVMQSVTIQWM